jgi:hypothetical protein
MVLTTPATATRVVTQVPEVVIEIVSPDDKQTESLLRFRDYSALGVRHIVQMEPEEHIAWLFQNDSLIRTDFHSLSLPGRLIYPLIPRRYSINSGERLPNSKVNKVRDSLD